MQAGDLKRQIRKAQQRELRFEERTIWRYFQQVAEGATCPDKHSLCLSLSHTLSHSHPDALSRPYLCMPMSALRFMHTRRVMHRDLKARSLPPLSLLTAC